MPSIQLDSLSPFGRVAVKLDNDFSELARLSGQIQRLDIGSDSGLERAIKILNQFAQHGQNITGGIQEFSRALQEAQNQSEAAAKLVAERALLVQQRRQQQNQIQEKLTQLEESVKAANANLAAFRKSGGNGSSDEEKRQLKAKLEELNSQLTGFIDAAQGVKDEAGLLKFRGLERDAGAVLGTLQSSRRKLTMAISSL